MRSDDRILIQSTAGNRPMKRHHTARYYAHRVKESLTTRVSKLICTIFLFILFVLGLITFILWLSLRPHRPRFHIHEFSIPSFSQENGYANANIIFNVTARNSNPKVGFYYDAVQVALNYQEQNIGDMTLLFPFYQEPKNTIILAGNLGGAALKVTGERWQQIMADRTRGAVNFSLELSSSIRFKIFTWVSKRHKIHATCAVGVGLDGSILPSYKDKKCPVYFT
ncbi:Late embryogenesis abundant (LEA) hydroxyproline-rich glycoprotein family [Forsythia ovata]|uniref:Late embryogenesis abundant (LEA) hydroxyproline-rich glycoprotein family n=1 Tax=Forsythia ovata TaxID=205694 RepID=A0ABD1S3L7_9LAMI